MYPTVPSLEYSTAMRASLLQSSHYHRLLLQVVLNCFFSVLAAYARLFYAAEGQLVVAEVELVYPGHAGLYLLGGAVDPVHVVREDGGAEAVGRVVGQPY